MNRRAAIVTLTLLVAGGCAGDKSSTRSTPELVLGDSRDFAFDESSVLPLGAESFSGRWQVRPELGAPSGPNALCQTATETFPALALSHEGYGDLVISTRFKAVSGSEDRAAGLIFRVQDSANYYILRANALEGNVNLYTYVKGKRSTVKEAPVPVSTGEWHELSVDIRGNRVTGQLDGRTVLSVDNATFTGAGRVGLWTKADSVTCFDDVKVRRQ